MDQAVSQKYKYVEIRYNGRCPKKVELPIPFVQMCEKTGEVICDPTGVFPIEDGLRLLEIAGGSGVFVLEKYIFDLDESGQEVEAEPEPEEIEPEEPKMEDAPPQEPPKAVVKSESKPEPKFTVEELLRKTWSTRGGAEYHMRNCSTPLEPYRNEKRLWQLRLKNQTVSV